MMLDVLSDILIRLSVQGTLYFRTCFTAPFGVKVPQFSNVARFHYAHRGSCRVAVSGCSRVVLLDEGDLVIVPHGASHCLMSPGVSADASLPLDAVLDAAGYTGSGVLVYGGEDAEQETQLICGHFSFAEGARHIIFEHLPAMLHIPRYGAMAGRWLSETLRMIGTEAERNLPGSDLIALRLSETILAQAIRTHLEQTATAGGPLAGFADEQLGRALAAIHAEPARHWDVAMLAREAGMSRSGFADRFARMIGSTPMTYLKRWRVQLAREGMVSRGLSVAQAAELAGYRSEAAFSRAFKRETGAPPSSFRSRRNR